MTFIISEIGVNWDGDFKLVEEMMSKSKEIGCNAVKFQSFNEDIVSKHPEKKRLMKASISKSNIKEIENISKSIGIEWFSTPMYTEAVELLDPFVNRFKIREFDSRQLIKNKSSEIMDKILETNKEVIISSQISPKNCSYYKNQKIKWLYCIPKYPCKLNEFDFKKINEFNGFSNHCTHILAPITASILGAEIIEIHITSDKSKKFVDNNVSFNYNELETIVNHIRLIEKMHIH